MSSAEDLAREVADLKRRLAAVERTAQLPRSSIDSGSLDITDETGATVLTVGLQEDGTYQVLGLNGGQVVASDVLDGVISDLSLADDAVTTAKIAANAVTATEIADGSISTPKLVAGAVQAGNIAAGAITAGKIATDAVVAGNIAALAVQAGDIAANAVTAGTIAANAVTAGTIAAGAISADKLTVGTQSAISSRIYDECGDTAPWTQQGGAGTLTVASVADSVSGGNVFRAVGKVGPLVRTGLIPFDPDALYRFRIRVRQTVNPATGGSQVLAGFAMLAADGVTYLTRTGGTQSTASAQVWVATTATITVAGGWQEFTGYLRGTSSSAGSTAAPNANTPATVHTSTRYIQPVIFLNFDLGTGTAELDLVAVDIIPSGSAGAVQIADGAITANKITAGAIVGQTLGSPNYVAGSAGFHVDGATGAAEFNNATLRGVLDIGAGSGANVLVTRTIPAELVAKYTTGLGATSLNYAILEYLTSSIYWYEITYTNNVGGVSIFETRARGIVSNAQVLETSRESTRHGLTGPSNTAVTLGPDTPWLVGANPAATAYDFQNMKANFGAGSNPALEDLQWAGTSLSRGVIAQAFSTAPSAAIGATETTVLTPLDSGGGTPVFRAGRVYRITYGTNFSHSLASGNARFRVRSTSTAGALHIDWGGIVGNAVAASASQCGAVAYVGNYTASDITRTLLLTLLTQSGGTVTFNASATMPRFVTIEDFTSIGVMPGAAPL